MRIALQRSTEPAPTEIERSPGVLTLVRNDGVTKRLTWLHLQEADRRAAFTGAALDSGEFADKVGEIVREDIAPDVSDGWGTLDQATWSPPPGAGQPGTFVLPAINRRPRPTQMPSLTPGQWFTMVKGLAAGPRATLRTAIVTALALDPADTVADGEFQAAQAQIDAAERLRSRVTDKTYTGVLTDLATIGITLTGPQQAAFDARWTQASSF